MKQTVLTFIFSLTILLVNPFGLNAQRQTDHQLHFKNLSFKPEKNAADFIRSFSVHESEIFDGKFYRIIQFDEIPSNAQKEVLLEAGIRLLDYIPNFGYFASFNSDADLNQLAKANAGSIIAIQTAVKLAPMLFEESYPDYALREDGRIELLVTYFADADGSKVAADLEGRGFEITKNEMAGNFLYLIAGIDNIKTIAGLPFVNYIEPIYPVPEPENYTGRTLHRSNNIANDFSTGRHYDGTGVSVMLQDDGQIGPHIDFEGRLLEQFIGFLGGDHGDHCAGIIGAAGNLDPKARGNAFGANLYTYGAAPEYPGFSAIPSHYFTKHIRVTSTSYSNGCNAGYTTLARMLDIQIINYPALMHVFSAGNDGGSDCGYGAGTGWGNITGGHKVGKNVMTVANLDYRDNLSGSSSRGPAHDGRIKPDVAAKGSDVYSTLPDNTYGYKSGTSMSCPGVAGVMAQLFHAYREMNDGMDPKGGLLKAIVLNTAEDLGNHGPDFRFGWGRVDALRAVEVLEDGRYDSAMIGNGQTISHQFTVPENTAQMRVMVYWTDYQGSVNTNHALVNNLDITVADPSGGEWMPWVLNPYPNADSLNMPAIRGYDDLNNMEQVSIENPEPGTYTLTVDGTTVPEGPQQYFVVYEYLPTDVVLTYPFGGEKLTPGDEEVIRWDAYNSDNDFTLEYSIDNGQTWELISDNIDGAARYFEWDVPSGMTAQAFVRVTRDGSVSVNQEPFSVMPVPTDLNVDWACDDAMHLSWTGVYGSEGYTVYQLGEKYMEPVATTNVNSLIIDGLNSTDTYWFAVSAVGTDGAESQRTLAIKKGAGTFNCNENDAMMVSAPSVEWGIFQSYMDINQLSVTVRVKNFGLQPITDPTLKYQLDDGAIVSETFNGTIEPDSTAMFTFTDTYELPAIGSYIMKTWVEYGPDTNPDNDMIETPIDLIEGSLFTPGNTQTLEDFDNCIPAPICELNTCDLGEGWINLTNNENDDIDWITWHGGTNTFNTGPDVDHTTGTDDGKFLYLEASVICFNKEAVLMAPSIDLTGGVSPALDFWYHAYGSDIGRLHVDAFDGAMIHYDVMEPVVGNQGDEWKHAVVDLSEFNGKVIGLRFRGYTGGADKGDLALDDIAITDVTSVGESLSSEQIEVFPNPTTGLVNISINGIKGDYELNIFDLYGRVVYAASENVVSGNINKVVDLSGLEKGVYFLELVSDNGKYNQKLTIQ